MINIKLAYLTAGIVMLGSSSAALAVEELPSTMLIVGIVQASAAVAPQVNDKIFVKQANGTVEGQGIVGDDSSSYSVIMSKTSAFNGTRLTMQFQQAVGGAIYELSDNNNPFSFNGGFPANQLTINPVIGSLITAGTTSGGGSTGGGSTGGGSTGSGSTGGGSTGNGSTGGGSTGNGSTSGGSTGSGSTAAGSTFDTNGDGQSNQQDIEQIKQALSRGKNDTNADINKDGIVNTRDIIDAIKAFRALSKKNI